MNKYIILIIIFLSNVSADIFKYDNCEKELDEFVAIKPEELGIITDLPPNFNKKIRDGLSEWIQFTVNNKITSEKLTAYLQTDLNDYQLVLLGKWVSQAREAQLVILYIEGLQKKITQNRKSNLRKLYGAILATSNLTDDMLAENIESLIKPKCELIKQFDEHQTLKKEIVYIRLKEKFLSNLR